MKQKKRRFDFKINALQAQGVYLCGTFNNWSESSDRMKMDSSGVWKKSKMLSQGIYEYKFLVDGDWTLDPECRETAPNGFGTKNNVITL